MTHIDGELDVLCKCHCGKTKKVRIKLLGTKIQKAEQIVNERLVDAGWNPITHECIKCQKRI